MDEPADWIGLDDEGIFALIGAVYQLRASGPNGGTQKNRVDLASMVSSLGYRGEARHGASQP